MKSNREKYVLYSAGGYYLKSLKEIALERIENRIWSARLSTGLFGLTSCKSGNAGPKGPSEVLLAAGDDGLAELVDLGFITCPSCRPETTYDIWPVIAHTVYSRYGVTSLEEFTDKTVVPFDASRIEWEFLLPIIGDVPNRLYVPKGMRHKSLSELSERFFDLGFDLPPTGYYDREKREFVEHLVLRRDFLC